MAPPAPACYHQKLSRLRALCKANRKPRQARKGATVAATGLCRGGPEVWHFRPVTFHFRLADDLGSGYCLHLSLQIESHCRPSPSIVLEAISVEAQHET